MCVPGSSTAFLLALCPEITPKGVQEIIGEAGSQTEFHYVQGKQLISCNISPKPTPLVFNCLIEGSIFFLQRFDEIIDIDNNIYTFALRNVKKINLGLDCEKSLKND